MKAILDANIVVSAAIRTNSPPWEIVKRWEAGRFSWIISSPLLDEIERVLKSPKIQRYSAWTRSEVDEFVERLAVQAIMVRPTQRVSVITSDDSDNRLLEAAEEARADYIVSGDNDLLALGSYGEIAIVTPARFLAILATN